VSAKLRIQPFHPSTLLIDQQAVRIRVARFDIDAFSAFRRDYARIDDAAADRPLKIRLPGDEQAMRPVVRPRTEAETAAADVLARVRARLSDDEYVALADVLPAEPTKDVFVIPDEEIRARRLAEMSSEARAAYDRAHDEEEQFAKNFIAGAVRNYVMVEDGEIEITEDGRVRSLTTGTDLVRFFGARAEVMNAAVHAIWIENTASDALKNVWRSLSGFADSSAGHDRAAAGQTPAPTAASADPGPSATTAAVMASIEVSPSGAMATLS
jgi:hypothetical protein